MGCGGDLLDVVGIEIHAQHVSKVVVLKQEATVVVGAVDAKKNNLTGGRFCVKHMGHTVGIDLEFKILSDGACFQQVVGPVCSAEIDLMKRPVCRSHQAPFKTVGGDVKGEMGRRHVFHDGSGVPPWSFEVRCALQRIPSHLQIVAVSVQNAREFVGGHAKGTIHQA